MEVDEEPAKKDENETEVKDLLYSDETRDIACPEDEPILMQLPGTLPFSQIKPHKANALEDMIELLSQEAPPGKAAFNQLYSDGENAEEDQSMRSAEPPKIGKLRIMKSGKVVMRI